MTNNKKESNTIDIDKILPDDLRLAKLYVMKINERENNPINTGVINSLFDYKQAIKSHIENKQKKEKQLSFSLNSSCSVLTSIFSFLFFNVIKVSFFHFNKYSLSNSVSFLYYNCVIS